MCRSAKSLKLVFQSYFSSLVEPVQWWNHLSNTTVILHDVLHKFLNMADLSKTFVRNIDMLHNSLTIHQSYIGDVGCVVWDAALVLIKYLQKKRKSDLNHRKVLELGAGTGIVGLCCCVAGADVTSTDLKELLPLIELNVKVNKKQLKGKFEVCELKWGENLNSYHHVDLLIMSDVIYYEESLRPLIDTICHSTNENTEVIVAYEERFDGQKQYLKQQFFQILGENFDIYKIAQEDLDEIFQSCDIHIVSMKRKQKMMTVT